MRQPTQNEIKLYSGNYSERNFWGKVKNCASKAGRSIIYNALLLYHILKSPETPVAHKVTIVAALGYLICPIDLIPDTIPVLGFTDDASALIAAIKAVQSSITPSIKAAAKADTDALFN